MAVVEVEVEVEQVEQVVVAGGEEVGQVGEDFLGKFESRNQVVGS